MRTVESKHLYYRDGSSDKVYQAFIIEKEPDKFLVNFAYGRRGNTLTQGTKTASPVTFDKAMAIYGKLLNEKISKGYIEKEGAGVAFSSGALAPRVTGFLPQLLNDIEEEDIETYINDPDWCAQEKMDGVRRGLIKESFAVTGVNRKGLCVPLSADIISAVMKAEELDFVLDGEAIGDKVYIFDCPMHDTPLKLRLAVLRMFQFDEHLVLVPTAYTAAEKAELFNKVKRENGEGIVFKNLKSVYTPGRPNSGGDQVKFKFVATATCMVTGGNLAGTSVSLCVFDGNKEVQIGNAKVYPKMGKLTPGTIVEVRYLYYFPGGSIFQPVLLGKRDDMSKEDCTLTQLKPKKETIENE